MAAESDESASQTARRWGQASWAVVGAGAVLGIVLWLAWMVRVIFPPLVLAGVIVLLLNPLVVRLERKRIPRIAATALLYVAGVAVLTLAVALIMPVVRGQAEDFRGQWPEVQARVDRWVADRENDVRGTPLEFSREDLSDQFNGRVTDRLPELWRAGDRVVNVLIVLLTGPVLAFYLLADLPRLRARAEELLPRRAAPEAALLARKLHAVVGGFIRGQIIVATIVGILTSAGLALLGLPFWALLGLIAGVSDLVPLVGPLVGGALAVVVALVTRDAMTAMWVVGAMFAVQQLESHVISPLVLHRTVKLHPAAVLLALLAGASLGGILGMLVAAPAVGALKVVVGHLWRVYVLGEPPEDMDTNAAVTDERKRLWLPGRPAGRDGVGDSAGRGTQESPDHHRSGPPLAEREGFEPSKRLYTP